MAPPKPYTCKHCKKNVTSSPQAHRHVCVALAKAKKTAAAAVAAPKAKNKGQKRQQPDTEPQPGAPAARGGPKTAKGASKNAKGAANVAARARARVASPVLDGEDSSSSSDGEEEARNQRPRDKRRRKPTQGDETVARERQEHDPGTGARVEDPEEAKQRDEDPEGSGEREELVHDLSQLPDDPSDEELARAAHDLVAFAKILAPPMPDDQWSRVWDATKHLWWYQARDASAAVAVSPSIPPTVQQWSSAIAFASSFVASTPRTFISGARGGSGAPDMPKAPTGLAFRSHGLEQLKDARAPQFVAKPASGQMVVTIGDVERANGRKFAYKLDDPPLLSNMLACQYGQVADVAVFANTTTMSEFTGDLAAARYGDALEAVRKSLVTGEIVDLLDFAGVRRGTPPTLRLLELALANVINEFDTHYGPTCELLQPLRDLRETGELAEWHKAACATCQHQVPSLPSHLVEADAARHVHERMNGALREWQRKMMLQLSVHFSKPNMMSVTDGGVSYMTRRVGCIGRSLGVSFDSCLARTQPYAPPHTLRAPTKPTRDPGTPAASPTKAKTPALRVGAGLDLAKNAVPKLVLDNQGRKPKDVAESATIPSFTYNGKEVCLRDLFKPGKDCGGCHRAHFWTLIGKSPALLTLNPSAHIAVQMPSASH